MTKTGAVTIRLRSDQLGFWVDLRLRRFDRGWLAVADLAHEPELGFGDSACEALSAALRPLGEHATQALMADPALAAALDGGRSARD